MLAARNLFLSADMWEAILTINNIFCPVLATNVWIVL